MNPLCEMKLFKILILLLLLLHPITTNVPKCKIEIKPTEISEMARNIYYDHGAGNKDLCSSFDKKTSRIHGYAVCKQAILKLYPATEFTFSVWCEYLNVETENRPNNPSKSKSKHSKSGRHKMVYCGYCNGNRQSHTYIYVMHAKDDFYYVLSRRTSKPEPDHLLTLSNAVPEACLEIKYQDFDFPSVNIKITDNKQEADNIFGLYGVGNYKTPKNAGHVCMKSENQETIIGDKICSDILKKLNLIPGGIPATCEVHKLRRYFLNECDGWPNIYLKNF